jgi:hypothetical protein
MDTNYRLLRAEIYSAIQRGIQDYKAEALDRRDMNVYFNVTLAGYHFAHSQFCLALQFVPDKPVRNWATSPQLMYGNLLCISPNGKFDEIIWATVAERDETILNKSNIIMVQVCRENNLTISDIYDRLDVCGGQAVMVESPTYFNALYPSLAALQEINIEEFRLCKAIVNAHPSLPTCKNLDLPEISLISEGLDDSQNDAFLHSLTNNLAIIQGPPGTGKTFIGVKVVEALLEMDVRTPIVVMTYKNHALDEFLKHVINISRLDDEFVVRIGGRSSERTLDQCNLTSRCYFSRYFGKEIYEARAEIEKWKNLVEKQSYAVDSASGITFNDLLVSLTDDQILSLLRSQVHQTHWVFKAVPSLIFVHRSLMEATQKVVSGFEKNQKAIDFVKEVKKALGRWIPDRKKLQGIRNFQGKLYQKNSKEEENDVDKFDEEDIRLMQESRMSLFQGSGNEERILQNLVLFDLSFRSNFSFRISDFPDGMDTDVAICDHPQIGFFNEGEKIRFIHAKIVKKRKPEIEKFEMFLSQLQFALEKKKNLEDERKLDILESAQVIGLTITGAAMHRNLLKKLAPRTVIVEEAAEILEASLLSSLGPEVERLILIGDHKQLRPSVETYELKKNCGFDISMMERLINCGFPYKALKMQNRMRPEFSELLLDIYPELEDNLELVLNNKPLPFMDKSMFFW